MSYIYRYFIVQELNLYTFQEHLSTDFVYHSLDFARDLHVEERAGRSARWIVWEICAKETDT